METEYKYIIHPNQRFTAVKATTTERWRAEAEAARIERAQPPSQAARALARRAAKRKRGQAARAKRKAQEIINGFEIRKARS